MDIYGFTFLRNGIQFDYPFIESLQSLTPLCKKIIIALGNSADRTEEKLQNLPKLNILSTVWDENNRRSGTILSEQTNIALTALRSEVKKGWAIYLQADEVLCEQEYEKIIEDLKVAEANNCDAVRFRYLHFWQNYQSIAVSRRWYPQEIRAVRIDSAIESYGDAQSFKNHKKIYDSNAHIFHFGHVREPSAYEAKKKDFHRWWHSDQEIEKVIEKGKKTESKEIVLQYLGPLPRVMNDRVQIAQSNPEHIYVYGDENAYSASFKDGIRAQKTTWTKNFSQILKQNPKNCVLLDELYFWQKLQSKYRFSSTVPTAMLSKDARLWERNFCAILKFSEKNVSLKNF